MIVLVGVLSSSWPALADPLGGISKTLGSVGVDAGSLGADARRPADTLIDRRTSNKSPAQAAREARQRYGGGKVLNVEQTASGFRVKLLTKGDVRIVFVPR
tara:strand:+ start:1091 stop:1393 length:303 start_codon:yes stop_codon:yes gene_type:complete